MGAQLADQIGIFGEVLGEDVARAFERRLHVRHFVGDVGGGEFRRHCGAVGEDGFGERPQAALAGDLGAGAALRLVGQIDVFELGLGGCGGDLRLQVVGQLALPRIESRIVSRRASSSRR